MPEHILGVSAFCHDAAAVILRDGGIIAAVQEERFTRKKHDSCFPANAIEYCLKEAGIKKDGLDLAVFHDEVFKKRCKKKLNFDSKILFSKHHLSHAASAFYPSPFERSAILTIDGLRADIAVSLGTGIGDSIKIHSQMKFPDSIGLLYSAFTHYCGFSPDSDEYKLMGLAPYGEPVYVDIILKKIIKLKDDGRFRINPEYFDYRPGHSIISKKFRDLFGGPPRNMGDRITKKEMDLARSVQVVTETALMNIVKRLHRDTKLDNLCMAGETALNCVANGRILREGPFKKVWIQPAASDAGCALGAALIGWHEYMGKPRKVNAHEDSQKKSLLGPSYSDKEIERYLRENNIQYIKLKRADLVKKVSDLLSTQKIIGWFEGRMEFGPRSLGNRSILADPRSKNMRDIINSKVKFREPFRPFAPSVLLEKSREYFDLKYESPYMLFVSPVKMGGFPAITHVDNSARAQTVKREDNPLFYGLIERFYKDTGCPMLINTSFNVMNEPIVCSPDDAYRCFTRSGMDYLAMGSFLIDRKKQV